MSLKILKFGDRNRIQQIAGDEIRTQQNMMEETDINKIMAKYQKTGVISHVAATAGQYGDFSNVPDYQTAHQRMIDAEALFLSIPARIRDRFGNDPAKFIQFASDPKNQDELIALGLAPRPSGPPEPQLVKVVREDEDDVPPKVAKSSKIPGKGDQ